MSDLARALLEELAGDPEAVARLRELVGSRGESGLLTPEEAAARLSVHPRSLVRAAAQGRVHGAVRAGKHWRFAADDLRLDPPGNAVSAPDVSRSTGRRRSGDAAANAIRGRG